MISFKPVRAIGGMPSHTARVQRSAQNAVRGKVPDGYVRIEAMGQVRQMVVVTVMEAMEPRVAPMVENIPHENVVVRDVPEIARVKRMHDGRAVKQMTRMAEGRRADAEVHAADIEVGAAVNDRPVMVVDGRPDKMVAVPHGEGPRGMPRFVMIAPNPAVVIVVRPVPVVGRDIGKGMVSDPDVTVRGDVAPMSVPVGHKIGHTRRRPGIVAIDGVPFAVGIQVGETKGPGTGG